MRAIPRRHDVAALLLGLVVFADAASAAQSWDGTWTGGWEKNDGVQIVIAGDKVTGVYRDGDYPEILSSEVSREGGMLTFWWVGGDAFLRRTGDREASISLRERGRPPRSFTVKRE
jgi:hypothetical protein